MSSNALNGPGRRGGSGSRIALRVVALGYLALLIVGPVAVMVWKTFADGLVPVWEALTKPNALHALGLTLFIAAIAVPLNTVFGVLCAMALVRQEFPGKRLLSAFLSLPLGVSPVVVGLALVIVYGRNAPIGGWFAEHGIRIIFSPVGMILATIFVTLPFVAREVVPVLQEIGTDQEQAASTLGASGWQTFWMVTLPAIRSGIAFGVVLTVARALGEYGAVSIVSGKLAGRTDTMTIYVEDRFLAFDLTGAYAASLVLAAVALVTLVLMHRLKPREHN